MITSGQIVSLVSTGIITAGIPMLIGYVFGSIISFFFRLAGK